jgi:hypothetical protein
MTKSHLEYFQFKAVMKWKLTLPCNKYVSRAQMLSLPISLFQKLYCKTVLFKVSDKAKTVQGKNNPNADIQNSALLGLQQRK